ncbi:TPA: hypothetical protein ACH3X2_005011 [Trebouxia sp. C0005]
MLNRFKHYLALIVYEQTLSITFEQPLARREVVERLAPPFCGAPAELAEAGPLGSKQEKAMLKRELTASTKALAAAAQEAGYSTMNK